MILHPRNLKCHVAAAQRGRYALNAIALTKKGTLSTDGHLLLFVPLPDLKPEDAPKIEGVNAVSAALDKPVLVSTEDAHRAAGMVGKAKRGSNASPWQEVVQAEIRGGQVVFGATDLRASQTMTVSSPEGEYPEIAHVLPDYSKALTVTVDIEQMLKALKVLKAASTNDAVTLRINSDQEAIGYSCADGVCLIQMPVTVEKPEEHCADQLAVLKAALTSEVLQTAVSVRGTEAPVARQDSGSDALTTLGVVKPTTGPAPDDCPEPEEEDETAGEENWQPTEAEMEAAFEEFQMLNNETTPEQPQEMPFPATTGA